MLRSYFRDKTFLVLKVQGVLHIDIVTSSADLQTISPLFGPSLSKDWNFHDLFDGMESRRAWVSHSFESIWTTLFDILQHFTFPGKPLRFGDFSNNHLHM
jgi:hypothetical protein